MRDAPMSPGDTDVSKEIRILFAGGGTGGHITPGLGVLDAARELLPEVRACWVGTPDRREGQVIPREGIEFFPLKVRTVKRGGSPHDILKTLLALADWVTLRPIVAAMRIVKGFAPDAVVATGGYVCLPVALVARGLRIPLLLMEQNAVLGSSVKLLSRFANCVLLAHEGSEKELPRSTRWEVIGNPVRYRTLQKTREQGRDALGLGSGDLVLLITGGSLGSKALDEACVGVLKKLDAERRWQDRLSVLFHTGETHFAWVQKALIDLNLKIKLFPYLEQMSDALASADVAVTRAGAMTVAELAARGLPAILIPWAGAVRDHQRLNCERLVSQGGARRILDSELSEDRLYQDLLPLLEDPESRDRMAKASLSLGRPDAGVRAVRLLMAEVASRRSLRPKAAL